MLKNILMVAALSAATVTSFAGAINWTTSPDKLLHAMQMHGTAVLNDYIYIIAGNTNASVLPPYSTVGDSPYMYYAPITGPGTVGEWTTCTAVLPDGLTAGQPDYAYINRHVNTYNGRIYVTGGNTNGPDFERESTLILTPEANGDILDTGVNIQPNDTGSGESIERFEHTSIIDQATGKIYVIGGTSSTPRSNSVLVAQIDSNTGAVGSFSQYATLAQGVGQAPAVILNGRLYVLGGYMGSGLGATATSQYLNLSDAAPATFTATTGVLPEARFDGDAEVLGGNIYLMGGAFAGNTSIRSDVFKATLDPVTGDITAWTEDSDLPVAPKPGIRRMASTSDANAIYIPGGRIDNTAAPNLSDDLFIGQFPSNVEDYELY